MKEFIDWEDIEKNAKGTKSGLKKIKCPKCIDSRTDKTDRSLSVNFNTGLAKCHYCGSIGVRDKNHAKDNNYKLPSQDWRNYTNLSDKLVKYLENERGISQSTAIALNWTQENYYQPALQRNVDNLVFNFFDGDTLVNKKYRSGNKKFTQSSGAISIFYNINSVIGEEEVYIVEGEFDVGAMYEIGIKNVISPPNGANDNDDYWKNSKEHLKHVKRFIIAVDNDKKGIELREKIAQRLGRYRCSFIEWKGKDANDDLLSGCLQETVKNIKRFPVSGTFKMSDLKEGVKNLYHNGLPDTIHPKHPRFGMLKNVFSVMRGQLTVGTGIPSHGKSSFTDDYVFQLLHENDFKASWFSPEHNPMDLYHTRLSQLATGQNFWGKADGVEVPRVSEQHLEKYFEWAEQKIYLTDCEAGEFPTWDWLLDKFKEQMYSYGIDIFIIDAFNKVLLPSGNKLEQINIVLTKLTSFAQTNNVMIFLVAHPTKMQKDMETGLYNIPTLYDVSGSADFRNQTHNGFTIYRYFENPETGDDNETVFINMKTKYSFQGSIGEKESFKYHTINGRYYANGIEPDYSFFDEEIREKEKNAMKPVDPLDAFGDIDNGFNNDFDPDLVPF